ncbi:MAG: transferase [Actinobacteria bacterium]|nr:transferase [Actinomycetota bacterium]
MEHVIIGSVALGDGARIDPFAILGYGGDDEPGLVLRIGAAARIRSHAVVYTGSVIGDRFHLGHGALLRERASVGSDVSIGSHTVVERDVRIADRVRIHSSTFVGEHTLLAADAWIGPNVTLTNVLHPLCPEAKSCMRGPRIHEAAKIGGGAIVLPDVDVGEMALVGAGAVVVADVPDRSVVVGAPARVIGTVDELSCPYDLIGAPYQ